MAFPPVPGHAARLVLTLVATVAVPAAGASAAGPRVLPADKLPADTRLGPLRGEQGDFSFVPAKSPESPLYS